MAEDTLKEVRSPEVKDQELPEIHYHNDIDQPAIDVSQLPSGIAHSSLSSVTANQHHNQVHAATHKSGSSDPLTGSDILDSDEIDSTAWGKNIIPDTDSSRNLGSSTKAWQQAWLDGILATQVSKVFGDSPYTAGNETVIICDATGGAMTVNLPTAVGIAGRIYIVKRTNSGANAVVVDANGAQTIDGATTRSLDAQWSAIAMISDNANWTTLWIMGTVT